MWNMNKKFVGENEGKDYLGNWDLDADNTYN
jgi:hypothetical protein